MLYKFQLQTPKEGFINITRQTKMALQKSDAKEGVCVVFCPHTTAGITINENADPDVTRDMLFAFDQIYPDRPEFCHFEGNTAAHLKASVVGCSATIIVEGGALLLGRWQGVYFCEFDGPRLRTFYVKIC